MPEVTKTFPATVDIKKSLTNAPFKVVEGDTGNVLKVSVVDDGSPVDLSSCRVIAVFSHAGGTAMQDSQTADGGVTIGGTDHNEVSIRLFSGSFYNDGLTECEIQIYSGTNNATLVTTSQFNFSSRRSIVNDDTIRSQDKYPVLTGLIEQVTGLIDGAQADWSEADTADPAYIQNKPDLPGAVASALEGAPSVGTLANADRILLTDASADAGGKTKYVLWSAVKTALSSVFAALSHASRHALGGADPLTGYEPARLQFADTSVPVSVWAADTSGAGGAALYADYPYRAAVALTGVLASMTPEVVFACEDAASGIFAPVAACYAGGVYLYASEVPEAAITISTIICWKAAM